MNSREEARKLYRNKYFYEIIKNERSKVELLGPLTDMYYCTPKEKSDTTYKFVKIVNGIIMQGFTENEILVTNKIL